jgi:tRNA-dihydrouridine synthase
MNQTKKNKAFFQEMISDRQLIRNTRERLKDIVEEKIKEDHFIDSIKEFQKELKDDYKLEVKLTFIRSVMR